MCIMLIDISDMNDFTLLKYYLTSLIAKEIKNGLSFDMYWRNKMDFSPKLNPNDFLLDSSNN